MARDTGSYTTSNRPVTDPTHLLSVSAASANNTTTLSYTTSAAHNLYVGAPVVIYGTGDANFNFNPDSQRYGATAPSATILGWGTPATVVSVTGTNTFTVKAPSVVATASVSTGYVVNDANDSTSPWAKTWLPTSAQTNVVVAKEWGNSFPIQPNDDRVAGTALANSAPSGNGSQVTYTVASHSFTAGQVVSIQGVVPDAYNLEGVTIAATTSTTIVVNSGITAPVTSYTGGSITAGKRLNGAQARIASATGATATGSVKVLTFTTVYDHNLTSGQTASISGSSNAEYNVQDAIVTTTGAKTFTVPAKTFTIGKVSGTSGSGVVGDGTNVLYYTTAAHGYAAGDKVSVYGMAPSGYNVADGTVLSAGLTATTFAIANTTTSAVTAYGTAIKQSGAFTAPAVVSLGDNGWSSTYQYPSGNLVAALDNHDRVTNSDSGYPDYKPKYTVPTLIGLPTTNAIQKIRAAGLKPGNVSFSSDLAVTAVSTTATNVTYTTGTNAHNLSVGDTVNLSGGSVAAHNLGDVNVASVSGFTFTVNVPGVVGTVGTGLVARPKNTVVSAQAVAAGTVLTDDGATSLAVGFTRNYGL